MAEEKKEQPQSRCGPPLVDASFHKGGQEKIIDIVVQQYVLDTKLNELYKQRRAQALPIVLGLLDENPARFKHLVTSNMLRRKQNPRRSFKQRKKTVLNLEQDAIYQSFQDYVTSNDVPRPPTMLNHNVDKTTTVTMMLNKLRRSFERCPTGPKLERIRAINELMREHGEPTVPMEDLNFKSSIFQGHDPQVTEFLRQNEERKLMKIVDNMVQLENLSSV